MLMTKTYLSLFKLSEELAQAKAFGEPIVALESTVITHGLPKPDNLKLAKAMEAIIRKAGQSQPQLRCWMAGCRLA